MIKKYFHDTLAGRGCGGGSLNKHMPGTVLLYVPCRQEGEVAGAAAFRLHTASYRGYSQFMNQPTSKVIYTFLVLAQVIRITSDNR
jgi:hypothetical protein